MLYPLSYGGFCTFITVAIDVSSLSSIAPDTRFDTRTTCPREVKAMKKHTKAKPAKPEKAYPEFPLCAHVNGRWCKRIRGRFFY